MDHTIFDCCIENNGERLRAHIQLGADINAKDHRGLTPLHVAVRCNSIECVKILMEAGAHVNARENFHGPTPLNDAIYHDFAECAKILMEAGGKDCVNEKDTNDDTLLHIAARRNSLKCLPFLLQTGGKEYINAKNRYASTPLHYAAHHTSKDFSQLLLEHGADITIRDDRSNTPLHEAVINDSIENSQLLLRAGADIKAKNDIGRTPLHIAALYNSKEILLLLLEACGKECVNAKDNDGYTALHLTIFLDEDDDIDIDKYKDCVRLLLEAGVGINEKDNKGRTFLDLIENEYFREEMEEYINELSTLDLKEPSW